MKWKILVTAGVIWLLYRQGQGSVSRGVQGVLQNTPVGPVLDTVGKTIDGAAEYVRSTNGTPAPLNPTPTGPYGTLGPDQSGIQWNPPNNASTPDRVILSDGTVLQIDRMNPSVRFIM